MSANPPRIAITAPTISTGRRLSIASACRFPSSAVESSARSFARFEGTGGVSISKIAQRLPYGIENQTQRKARDRTGPIRKCEIVIDPILLPHLSQGFRKACNAGRKSAACRKRRVGRQTAAPSKRPGVGPGKLVDVIRYGRLRSGSTRPAIASSRSRPRNSSFWRGRTLNTRSPPFQSP